MRSRETMIPMSSNLTSFFDGHLDLFLAPKVYIVRCFESHSPVFNALCQIKISFNFILTLNWTFIVLMCPNIFTLNTLVDPISGLHSRYIPEPQT